MVFVLLQFLTNKDNNIKAFLMCTKYIYFNIFGIFFTPNVRSPPFINLFKKSKLIGGILWTFMIKVLKGEDIRIILIF